MDGISQSLNLIYLIPVWIFFGLLTAFFARRRGKDPFLWFFVGLVFGLLGLLFLFLLSFFERKRDEIRRQSAPQPPPEPVKPFCLSEQWNQTWFYLDTAHQQVGPLICTDFIDLWKSGVISQETYVWCEGMVDWKKMKDLPDLLHELSQLTSK